MALHLFCSILSAPTFTCISNQPKTRILVEKSSLQGLSRRVFECMAVNTTGTTTPVVRRSANYKPSIWDYDYIQNLTSEFADESYVKRAEKLKEDVRMILQQLVDPLQQLEMIDTLQRLGLSYHYENETKRILKEIYNDNYNNYSGKHECLYATALKFRHLRQHGFSVPQEIFNNFRDEKGNFKSSYGGDYKGILSLYDAAYLLMEGENIFENIISFTTPFLKEYVKLHEENEYLCTLIKHSLELPLHWRMLRSETRWFIDVYQKNPNMNPDLLEFAILDFNILQAKHQEELKHVSRWWRNIDAVNDFGFSRDRIMENFLWSTGMIFKPQFGYCRKSLTKLISLLIVVDDIYDVYGTLDELELFTDIVQRWDVRSIDALPNYMKICFLALQSIVNEFAFKHLKEHGMDIIPYLIKGWSDLCKSVLVEARWYFDNYTPSFEEYIDNSWISITGPIVLMHGFLLTIHPTKREALKYLLVVNPPMIRSCSMIFRLMDDLATSTAELRRGDVPKSVQCYMNETGVSEVDAREHIKNLIRAEWMKLNKTISESVLLSDSDSIGMTLNFARTTLLFYGHGDGIGVQDLEIKDHVLSLIANPISNLPIKK